MVSFTTLKWLPSKAILLRLPPLYTRKVTVCHTVLSRPYCSAHLNFEISLPMAAKQRTQRNLDSYKNVPLLRGNTTVEQTRPPTCHYIHAFTI